MVGKRYTSWRCYNPPNTVASEQGEALRLHISWLEMRYNQRAALPTPPLPLSNTGRIFFSDVIEITPQLEFEP
jgi:hypothetical protein